MDKIKNQFEIIYLLDSELGIESFHENERPCLIIKIYDDESGLVIPISSQPPKNFGHSKYQLSFGSWIDFRNNPIEINKNQMTYSRLADYNIDSNDICEIEEKYEKWI